MIDAEARGQVATYEPSATKTNPWTLDIDGVLRKRPVTISALFTGEYHTDQPNMPFHAVATRVFDCRSGALIDARLLAEVYIAGFASLRMDVPQTLSSKSVIWTPEMETELFAYLRRNPAFLRELTPRRFEELVAAIFRNNGFSVELTPESRDGGVDIIAVQHSALTGDLVHFIECKRYRASRKVGIGVVQRLLGAVSQRHATKGIVVTTSSFSRDAIRAAEDTRHVMTLNDYEKVVAWIRDLGGAP